MHSNSQISELAYQIWKEGGCPEGNAERDWAEAVRRLASAPPPTDGEAGARVPDELSEDPAAKWRAIANQ